MALKVRRRCMCRGWITADPEDPTAEVYAHVQSPIHTGWRMGMMTVDMRPGLPTPDGMPVTRLVKVA